MNTYLSLLQQLYTLNQRKGMDRSLQNVMQLDEAIGNPHQHYQTVHIAGTNGKGSVTTKIAKGLEAEGLRVGCYTSPHLFTFRERISINGIQISEEDVMRILSHLFSVAKETTFFEITTLLAFQYFVEQKVDIAVVETGLGGRLDATNMINSSLAVITSIAFDHTEFLGETLKEIAAEKGGIIKGGVPVILGPSAACVPIPPDSKAQIISGSFNTAEEENCAIARAALEMLNVSEKNLLKALDARPPCRRERHSIEGVPIMIDIAHNPQALEGLFREINKPPEKIELLFSLSRGKKVLECLKVVERYAQTLHLPVVQHPRSLEPQSLLELLPANAFCYESVQEAFSAALKQAKQKGSMLVICGSFFMMDEVYQCLGKRVTRDPFSLNETLIPKKT